MHLSEQPKFILKMYFFCYSQILKRSVGQLLFLLLITNFFPDGGFLDLGLGSSPQPVSGSKQFVYEKQRYDGWFNNMAHPEWGTVGKCYGEGGKITVVNIVKTRKSSSK